MIASLYQSGSAAGSWIGFDMRLDSWRNNQERAINLEMETACLQAVGRQRSLTSPARGRAGSNRVFLFLRQRHRVGGDALPFAVSFDPGVGETVAVGESLAGFCFAG